MIVMNGFYGAGNFGDDIIMLSIINSIREHKPDEKFVIIAISAHKVPLILNNIEVISRWDINKITQVISQCDLLITGGGGIFQDYSGFDVAYHMTKRDTGIDFYTVPMEIAYLLSKPIMVYGVGIGPISNPIYERYFKISIPWANRITVRDITSLEIAKELVPDLNVEFTVDPAINFLKHYNNYSEYILDNKEYVGICLRHWHLMSSEEVDRFTSNIAKSIDYINTKYNLDVVLFPFCNTKNDDELLIKVYNKVLNKNRVLVKPNISMHDAVGILHKLKLLIGMRLHSLLVQSTLNIPCIGISYDDKVYEYMKLLELEAYSVNLNEVSYESLKLRIDNVFNNYNKLKNQITNKMIYLKQKEKINAKIALSLIGEDYN
ncbi:MAG: polysaccharide pyruvyl transferase family protein [Peptostreptococcaceae bacterium]|nr:polysaccharide pyruvyl transferase family protein [Peptostreptococcaceae bacterium]